MISTRGFSMSTAVPLNFNDVLRHLWEALRREGLDIVAELDLGHFIEHRTGLRRSRYVILAVCNPVLAFQSLLSDRDIGVLLPFHVVVAEDGLQTLIAALNPGLIGDLRGKIGFQLLARDAVEKFRRAMAAVEALAPEAADIKWG
ncbi:MAG TPA: DUF302 domain-containing protein [Candidatus Acidoferrales bacterium]